MANDYTAEVLRYIRRKGTSGFEPVTWLGSEQRFVGALRNSGINNLEEQYVLGTDTYTVTYQDSDGNDIIEKSFCVTPSDTLDGVTDYYKVVSTIYNNPDPNEDYKFDGDSLVFSNVGNDILFGDGSPDYPYTDSIYFLDNNTFSFVDDTLDISPSTFTVIRKDDLYFIQSDLTELLVLTKVTGERYTSDGKKIVREKITNVINP